MNRETHEMFVRIILKKEEDILKELLRQVIGRDPVMDDFKDCTKFKEPGDDLDYWITYKDQKLGRIEFIFDGPTFTVKFTPTFA